jgi:hypothetical protein
MRCFQSPMAVDISMVPAALLMHLARFRAGLFTLAAEPHPSNTTKFPLQADKTHYDTSVTLLQKVRSSLPGFDYRQRSLRRPLWNICYPLQKICFLLRNPVNPPYKIFCYPSQSICSSAGAAHQGLKTPQTLIGSMPLGPQTFLDWYGKIFES